MSLEQKLLKMKREIADARAASDRARGADDALRNDLRAKEGLDSFDEVPAALETLDAEIEAKEWSLKTALDKLEEKWPD